MKLLVYKNWEFDTVRECFIRNGDGLTIDKAWAYKVIDLNADSLEKELNKLVNQGLLSRQEK